MRRSWPDLPGVGVWAWPAGAELHVRIADDAAPARDDAVEAEWSRRCAANPRLFDGPVLSVLRIDPGREIVCRRESYKRLAVQDAVNTGVEQLSVTGVVLGRNEAGRECVLLGRRGRRTRIYGGMWELAPSGGLDPTLGRCTLCEGDLAAQLQKEFEEETGARDKLRAVRARAIVHDLVAHSYDVVFVCHAPLAQATVGLSIEPDHWEYEGVRWVPIASLARFDHENAPEIIEPTRALWRFFDWI